MKPGTMRVVERTSPAPGCWELVLEAPWALGPFQPGQFYMLRAGDEPDTYLPRPFSFYRVLGDRRLSFLFRVVGPGTALLAGLEPGEPVGALGPLGTGFPRPEGITRATLVGGGVGVPPLWSLTRALSEQGVEVRALIGARSADELLGVREVEDAGAQVLVATDDGSSGYHGFVTDLLTQDRADVVYACGPAPMLRAVQRYASGPLAPPTYLSLEAPMACGYGVCLGCAVERTRPDPSQGDYGRYARVCREGPVFSAGEVVV